MDIAFYLGLGLVILTFVIGLAVAKPYTADNFQQAAVSKENSACHM